MNSSARILGFTLFLCFLLYAPQRGLAQNVEHPDSLSLQFEKHLSARISRELGQAFKDVIASLDEADNQVEKSSIAVDQADSIIDKSFKALRAGESALKSAAKTLKQSEAYKKIPETLRQAGKALEEAAQTFSKEFEKKMNEKDGIKGK